MPADLAAVYPLCWFLVSSPMLGPSRRRADAVCGGQSRRRPHRLVAQDTALSRRRHGFESRWGRRQAGWLAQFGLVGVARLAREGRRHRPQAAGIDMRNAAGPLGHCNAPTTLNVHSHFVAEGDREVTNVLGRIFDDEAAVMPGSG